MIQECVICKDPSGDVLYQDALCRVVLVGGDEGRAFPGFCRVILNRHVSEMSDLSLTEQRHLMETVLLVERVVRDVQQPDKMNLASLGNVVPHVHWHVIPRWNDDSHFPDPIWAMAQRKGKSRPTVDGVSLRKILQARLGPEGST